MRMLACSVSVAVCAACGIDDTHVKLARKQGDSPRAPSRESISSRPQQNLGVAPGAAPSPDQDFLHKMSDHHKGLIVLTHEAIERTEPLPVKDEARSLDRAYDAALREMETLLRENFQDYYEPQLTTEYSAQLDDLTKLHGARFVAAFRQRLKDAHQQALDLINEYLPTIKRETVRAFALRTRSEERRALARHR